LQSVDVSVLSNIIQFGQHLTMMFTKQNW